MQATWQTTMEATAAVVTALTTVGSLIFLWRYVTTTDKLHQASLKQLDESVRPVLLLARVEPGSGLYWADFKNVGSGIALNVRHIGHREVHDTTDNVLAVGGVLTFHFRQDVEGEVIEVQYSSISGKELCTLALSMHGIVYNEYIPNRDTLTTEDLKNRIGMLKGRAVLDSSTRTLGRIIEQRDRSITNLSS